MVHGRVYTIRSHQTTDIYIGSTIQTLSMRMAYHRSDYKKYLNETHNFITSFEIIKYGDAYIELLYEDEFESKDALRKKEGEYIREMNCVNRCIAGRTKEEFNQAYYQEHKEHIIEQNKQYQQDNKKQIQEYKHQRYENNKEQFLEQQKEYASEHKKEKAKYDIEYREKNKERLKEQRLKKYAEKKKSLLKI